jgi:nicotinamide riboside kinase
MEEHLKQEHTEIIKIAFVGPESTGKTTLASQLAEEFNTNWIPEFARDYLQDKWDLKQEICSREDLMPIAIGQTQLENQALKNANKILFCDTIVLVTKVFSDINYNSCDAILAKAAKKHKYDLIFLTDVDVPWEKDDLRDKPNDREESMAIFEQALVEYKKPFIKLSGSKEERLEKATKIISDFQKAKKLGLNSFDYIKIYNRNTNLDVIEDQFQILKSGIPKINLERPAIINDGILRITDDEAKYFSNFFDEKKTNLKLKKFVPASGAASRMFKFLNEFLNEFKLGEESINAYINRKKDKNLPIFLVAKEKFPFYNEILEVAKSSLPEYGTWEKDTRDFGFIKTMLSPKYFDFSNKPKGVLPFHKYENYTATAIEEHLNECAFYATSNGKSNLHFTVSEEHQNDFETIINEVKPKIEKQTNAEINVKYSYQNKATDVIAVDLDGNPFRDEKDNIVFRPGGHGALIENLNNLNADVIFIKNIDNVIQNHIQEIALYKKALAGILIQYQEVIFKYMKMLNSENVSNEDLNEIVNYIKSKLNIDIKDDFSKFTKESKVDHLKTILNRPIRVCGMVKNEGEPGGGPFWVIDKKGKTFLQIIESSQIDSKDTRQKEIFESATHFNPVDLVCGIKDYNGQKFDLMKFIDKNSGFIVEKNNKGKSLRAFELPGLWNGAMAKWMTVFVEVPLITFNPVKTVNDLLKPAHQSTNGQG